LRQFLIFAQSAQTITYNHSDIVSCDVALCKPY
jgi:hypothetical protein